MLSGKVKSSIWGQSLRKNSILIKNSWPVIHGPGTPPAGTTCSSCSEEVDPDWMGEQGRKHKKLLKLKYSRDPKVEELAHQTGEKKPSCLPFLILIQDELIATPGAKPSAF